MKRKINKLITLVKNPKSLLGLNILLAAFSSLLFLVETSVVSKVTNIKEILGDTLNQYSLVSQIMIDNIRILIFYYQVPKLLGSIVLA